MKKPQVLLGCLLSAISIMLPQLTGATTVPDWSPQANKAGGARRGVSQTNLESIEPLKKAFERDSAKVRLVTILSPT
jgi:hypothetical protein